VIALLVSALIVLTPQGDRAEQLMNRAIADFLSGHVAESVAGFDQVAAIRPDVAPELWQRGIALYYAGRYQDCRAQFELHRTVNPNDVENAAWHFLCVARAESPERARALLLPVGRDARRPMAEVLELFRGKTTPDDVLASAGSDPRALFYAHLYVGLYFDAIGSAARALPHITEAASDRYRDAGGYMHAVARVHLDALRRGR
jgi:lipoprotein NlpI